MKRILNIFGLLALLAAASMVPALAADGPGSCGKGKIWDADQNKCVAKPARPGSHAGN